jgi:hypothetical protein
MSCGCQNDIHTCHAELIHSAADIQFIISYLNGTLNAQITDIGKYNVQAALERYFSLHGIPVTNEIPSGLKNRVNLTYRTSFEFVSGTLEVFLSGLTLNGNQLDPERDFSVHPDNKGFTIVINAGKASALNCPPRQDEPLFVNYRKRITFNTLGGT